VRSTLSNALKKLPPEIFLKTHRSYAVNILYVDFIQRDHLLVGDKIVPIAKQYYKSVMGKLNIIEWSMVVRGMSMHPETGSEIPADQIFIILGKGDFWPICEKYNVYISPQVGQMKLPRIYSSRHIVLISCGSGVLIGWWGMGGWRGIVGIRCHVWIGQWYIVSCLYHNVGKILSVKSFKKQLF